jgi:hypothetical protein
MMEYQHQ